MTRFIAQKEMECQRCEAEIPRGAWFYDDGGILCEDCHDEIYEDE